MEIELRIGVLGPVLVQPLLRYLRLADAAPLSRGSGGPAIVNIILGLMKYGHDVSVYSFGADIPEGQQLNYRGDRLRIYLGHYRSQNRMRDVFRCERDQLREMIRFDQPTILHAHWTYEFALASLDSGLPALVTVHDCAARVLHLQPDLYRLGRYMMNRSVLKRAKYLSAVSPYIQEYVSKFSTRPIHLIPNLVAVADSEESIVTSSPDSPFRVASFVSWGRMRNAERAIHAFQEFRVTVRDAQYHLYGQGFGQQGAAHSWAQSRGLLNGLVFHGQVEYQEALAEMGRSHVVLHPSLEESFSLVVAEAMALGRPVVAGVHSGGVPWVLEHGKAGILVDVRRQREIVRALLFLHQNPAFREEIGACAKIRAAAMFSSRAVIPKYEAIYDSMLNSLSSIGNHGTRS